MGIFVTIYLYKRVEKPNHIIIYYKIKQLFIFFLKLFN